MSGTNKARAIAEVRWITQADPDRIRPDLLHYGVKSHISQAVRLLNKNGLE